MKISLFRTLKGDLGLRPIYHHLQHPEEMGKYKM